MVVESLVSSLTKSVTQNNTRKNDPSRLGPYNRKKIAIYKEKLRQTFTQLVQKQCASSSPIINWDLWWDIMLKGAAEVLKSHLLDHEHRKKVLRGNHFGPKKVRRLPGATQAS
uniref:Uncharacterized protein n=1 Tax=Aureoumbra lagunensis TaxID=44058 RepID=A0A7S3NNP4_9STRA